MADTSFRRTFLRHACANRGQLKWAFVGATFVVIVMAFWLPSFGPNTGTGVIVRVNIITALFIAATTGYVLRRCNRLD